MQAGNVTCNAVCPGYMLTELVEKQLAATAKLRGMSEVSTVSACSAAYRRKHSVFDRKCAAMACCAIDAMLLRRMRSCRRCCWPISRPRRLSAWMR